MLAKTAFAPRLGHVVGEIIQTNRFKTDGGAGFGVAQQERERGPLDRNGGGGKRQAKFGWIHIHGGCRLFFGTVKAGGPSPPRGPVRSFSPDELSD